MLELSSRFTEETQLSLPKGHVIIPSQVNNSLPWKDEFLTFAEIYKEDLPFPGSIDAELETWSLYWSRQDYLPSTSRETLNSMDKGLFPNLTELLQIICTLPITSCECERSVSALRCLKTLRSTISQDRLNGLALLHVHYSMHIDLDKVIDLFRRKHPRRLTLFNILDTD